MENKWKVGDIIKCSDSNEAIHIMCELIRKDVQTEVFKRESDGTVTIRVARIGGKF